MQPVPAQPFAHGSKRSYQGFTIVELLVATVVFSSVLVILTAGVIFFTKQYYKGAVQSKTQTVSRKVADTVSQAIQFGDGTFKQGTGYYCIGNKRFSYVLQSKVVEGTRGSGETYHGLVVDSPGSCSGPKSGIETTESLGDPNAEELLGVNMRLTDLDIDAQGGGLYSVKVRVVYGERDAFVGSNPANECDSSGFSQFCATSVLSTTVNERLN